MTTEQVPRCSCDFSLSVAGRSARTDQLPKCQWKGSTTPFATVSGRAAKSRRLYSNYRRLRNCRWRDGNLIELRKLLMTLARCQSISVRVLASEFLPPPLRHGGVRLYISSLPRSSPVKKILRRALPSLNRLRRGSVIVVTCLPSIFRDKRPSCPNFSAMEHQDFLHFSHRGIESQKPPGIVTLPTTAWWAEPGAEVRKYWL